MKRVIIKTKEDVKEFFEKNFIVSGHTTQWVRYARARVVDGVEYYQYTQIYNQYSGYPDIAIPDDFERLTGVLRVKRNFILKDTEVLIPRELYYDIKPRLFNTYSDPERFRKLYVKWLKKHNYRVIAYDGDSPGIEREPLEHKGQNICSYIYKHWRPNRRKDEPGYLGRFFKYYTRNGTEYLINSELDRFINRISRKNFDFIGGKRTVRDFINVTCEIPMANPERDTMSTVDLVKKYKSDIFMRIYTELSDLTGIPMNYFKIDSCMLTKTDVLVTSLSLKGETEIE